MEQLKWSVFITFFLSLNHFYGQLVDFQNDVKKIESLLLEDDLQKADSILQGTIAMTKQNKNYEGLSKLVYWSGKIELAANEDGTFPKAMALSQFIQDQTENPVPNYQSNLDLSRLFNEGGDLIRALDLGQNALQFAFKTENKAYLVNCYYYLGEYNLRSGNINPFFENIKKGHQILLKNPKRPFRISARILNYMGAIKYFSSEPDSAYYFYKGALDKVNAMDDNAENRLYFPAAIKANMVLLKQSQNEFEEALALAEECILLNKRFLDSSKKHPLRFRSQRNLSLAYRNLASLYEQIVDYDKSHQIAQIAYHHGKSTFEPKLLEYFSAVTLLAESKILIREFDPAIAIMKEAKKSLDAMEGKVPLLRANYHSILAGAHYGKKEYQKAKIEYEYSNEFHLKAQKQAVTSDRVFATINLALCHAQLGDKTKAFDLLDEAYDFQIQQNHTSNRILEALTIAKARATEILEDYPAVLASTNIFLQTQRDSTTNRASEVYKTEAITLNVKARYHLQQKKSVPFLQSLDQELDSTIALLEKRKAFIESKENINALITENLEVFELAKKINLELYQATSKKVYLEKLIGLHESSIYTRIRTRLNLSENIAFLDLPKEIQEREKIVQGNLKKASSDIDQFLKAAKDWDQLLDTIQTLFPEYYQMRYATLFQPLERFQQNIPNETTIIRYIFIDQKLYAYVANSAEQQLTSLHAFDNVPTSHLKLLESDIVGFNQANAKLFNVLWKPIAEQVKTKNVIIYPDQALFNLSFEVLSPEKVNSFGELASKSLLAQYNISYNYSLLLLGKKDQLLEFERDFVAFAPEFSSAMKDDYQMAISDSLFLDKAYLTLLPQPFSSEIASRYSKKFNGSSFLNESASKTTFTKNANEHKIIHIGTHAESNNINPELSRLVFAKDVGDSLNINDNYLYTYEIYNQNLSSNLAILTACETGKPTYQPGEGMISLAHAFNYAGSESILTSLWQIDEQSSTQILGFFYEYLSEGKPKDEALRLAKLDYLKTAEGRTLHPQYWAGLILMGDITPIELSNHSHWSYWLILGIVLLLLLFYLKPWVKSS